MKHQNLDLRDVVKDTMYREARGLSHKTIKRRLEIMLLLNFEKPIGTVMTLENCQDQNLVNIRTGLHFLSLKTILGFLMMGGK